MKRFLSLLLLFFLISSAAISAVRKPAPQGSPTRAIQDLEQMLESYILRPKTAEERQFNEELKKKVIQGTFDIRELCRLALGKHWKPLSERERNHHVDLMTRLLEKKAIFSKEQGGSSGKGGKAVYYVTYEGDQMTSPAKKQAVVRTLVQIPSENLKIGLNYKVVQVGGTWKIFDVIVDDASLVDNYRYQFDKIISQHGYEDLIRRMESKLKELEEKEGKGDTPTAPPAPEKKPGGCQLTLPSP